MTSSFRLTVSKRMPIKNDCCLFRNRHNQGDILPENTALPLFLAPLIAIVRSAARVVKW